MSNDAKRPVALLAAEAPARLKSSNYPEPFFTRMLKRDKRPLGDLFGLTNFGVNLTRLAPGGSSALRHAHAKQDEFVYILEGRPTLITDAGRTPLNPGMCAGFKGGSGDAHHLVNETDRTSSISKSATGRQATASSIPTMISPPLPSKGSGASSTRTGRRTEGAYRDKSRSRRRNRPNSSPSKSAA